MVVVVVMESLAYGALPKELVAMSEELENLGGGDTRIAKMGVYVRVIESPTKKGGDNTNTNGGGDDYSAQRVEEQKDDGSQSALFQPIQGGFAVRDPRCGEDVPVDQAWREYKTTGFFGSRTPQSDVHAEIGHSVVDWVLDGFSACVLMLGQANSGKSYTLFGKDCHDDRGIAYRVLEELWDKTSTDVCTIGMSVWNLSGDNEVVDRLGGSSSGGDFGEGQSFGGGASNIGLFDPTVVRVSRFSDIVTVLDGIVRQNFEASFNRDHGGASARQQRRMHLFLRFSLYDTSNHVVSHLHFVDLAGSQKAGLDAANESLDCHERQRRACNAQLLSLNRLISEVSHKHHGGEAGRITQLTTLRESALNHFVGPVLAGNCRTWVVGTVSANSDDFVETANTMRVLTRAMSITSACYRDIDTDNGQNIRDSIAKMRCREENVPSRAVKTRELASGARRKPIHVARRPKEEDEEEEDRVRAELDCNDKWKYNSAPSIPSNTQTEAFLTREDGDEHPTTAVDALEQIGREYFHGSSAYVIGEGDVGGKAGIHGARERTVEKPSTEEDDDDEDMDLLFGDTLMELEAEPIDVDDLGARLEQLKSEFRDIYSTIDVDASGPPTTTGTEVAEHDNAYKTDEEGRDETIKRNKGSTNRPRDAADEHDPATSSPEEAKYSSNTCCDGTQRGGGVHLDQLLEINALRRSRESEARAARDEIEELKRQNSQLMIMFRRERQMVQHLKQQVTDSHTEMLETSTQYEVGLETLRAEVLGLKSKCRQLESETTFAEVFDKYEHEIDDLATQCKRYREEAMKLKAALANATSTRGGGSGGVDEEEDDARIAQLRKLLRKAGQDIEKHLDTIEELRKQNRHYEFHKKGHEEAYKRISSIQKQLNRKTKEHVQASLLAAEQDVKIGKLREEVSARVDAEARVARENAELVETIRSLNEDMESIRVKRRTENLLTKLPTMKVPMAIACKNHHGCKTSHQCVALELAKRLQREITQTPRIENTFQRLVKEIELMEEEKEGMERREALLVQMMTAHTGSKKR